MRTKNIFLAITFILSLAILGCQKYETASSPELSPGGNMNLAKGENVSAVYTQSNAAGGNEILMYNRSGQGTLSFAGAFSTGGLGSGSGLGSQGAVVLYNGYLFAVNAGSNEVSIFSAGNSGLSLLDKEPSGGTMPISLTVYKNLLYVLNAGGTANITGFYISDNGTLSPIPGSTRPLSNAAPGPAQVQFHPSGNFLVVTEKATNLIDTYIVNGNGLASGPVTQPSAGNTPFGFEFDKRGNLIVSEAFGGAALQGAMSSYNVGAGGTNVITGPVFNTQTAPCWVVVTKNGKFTYTSNTGTGNISGYYINQDGGITLFNDGGNTASTGAGSLPIDMAVSNNSQYLYVLNAGAHTISGFEINNGSGKLTSLQTIPGLPLSAVGLAAN